jgi:Ran GTPase-activating protein (RanGAP) involved in mRNA processing and transport
MSKEDVEFCKAFFGIGEHSSSMKYVTKGCREHINRIRNNSDNVEVFQLMQNNARQFTDTAWNLLGRYITSNNHLKQITLSRCGITDDKMTLLFNELACSTSLKDLYLSGNFFGREGMQSMISLLQNSPQLIRLLTLVAIPIDTNVNTECFEVVVSALHNRGIKRLNFGNCNITGR